MVEYADEVTSLEPEPEFDGSFPADACGMDTQPEAERVFRELWARKPLADRIEFKRAHWRWVQSIGRQAAKKRAETVGLDVTMLEANLDRTVSERLRRHGIALNTMTKMRGAKRCDNLNPSSPQHLSFLPRHRMQIG